MIDRELLKRAKAALLEKRAYVPMTPEAQAAAQQAAAMPPMPPMDPGMMQGAPMPPMDPNMMQGGALMDPGMMQGAPMPPMDPGMMQGEPGLDPNNMPIVVNLSDLKEILRQAVEGQDGVESGEGNSNKVTNKELKQRLDQLIDMLSKLVDALGVNMSKNTTVAPSADSSILSSMNVEPSSVSSPNKQVTASGKRGLNKVIEKLKH